MKFNFDISTKLSGKFHSHFIFWQIEPNACKGGAFYQQNELKIMWIFIIHFHRILYFIHLSFDWLSTIIGNLKLFWSSMWWKKTAQMIQKCSDPKLMNRMCIDFRKILCLLWPQYAILFLKVFHYSNFLLFVCLHGLKFDFM